MFYAIRRAPSRINFCSSGTLYSEVDNFYHRSHYGERGVKDKYQYRSTHTRRCIDDMWIHHVEDYGK